MTFVLGDDSCNLIVTQGDTIIADGKEIKITDITIDDDFGGINFIRVKGDVFEKTINLGEEKNIGGVKVKYENFFDPNKIEISIVAPECKYYGKGSSGSSCFDKCVSDVDLRCCTIVESGEKVCKTMASCDEKQINLFCSEKCSGREEPGEIEPPRVKDAGTECKALEEECFEGNREKACQEWKSNCNLPCPAECEREFSKCVGRTEECVEILHMCKKCDEGYGDDSCPGSEKCSGIFIECNEERVSRLKGECKEEFVECKDECTVERGTLKEFEEKEEIKEFKPYDQCDTSECAFENRCVPIGTRVKGRYCSIFGEFEEQEPGSSYCENNYECESNSCLDSECTAPGFWKGFFNLFTKFFSGTGQFFRF
mgnify:CR=1 FL=1